MSEARDEITRLQGCLNDLITVVSLPAIWRDQESSEILSGLLKCLVHLLHLDVVYARVSDPAGAAPTELVSVGPDHGLHVDAHEIGRGFEDCLNDDSRDRRSLLPNPVGDCTISIVPIRFGTRDAFDVLVAGSRRPDFPTEIEMLLLRVAVNQAAIGFQEARQLSDQRRAAAQLEQRVLERTQQLTAVNAELLVVRDKLAAEVKALNNLHEFSTRMLAATSLPQMLEDVLDAIISLLNADFGNVQLYSKETCALEIVAQRGFQREFLEHFRNVRGDDSASCGRALQQQTRVIIEDVQIDSGFAPHRHVAEAAGYRAVQSTPLLSRAGEFLGIVSTHFRQAHRPSDHELRLTDLYARQAAEMIERKRAETALKRSKVQLAEGQRLSHTGSWSWNAETCALFWSQEQYRIFGLDPEQEAPTYELFLDMVHPDDRSSLRRHFEDAAERGRDFEQHYRIVRRDGTVRYIHALAYPVFGESGELAEYIGTLIDTTEQKRAAMALLRTQDELAHVTRVMSMGELTASIAHEVNQPLSGITINGRACLRWLAAQPPNIDEARATVECIIRDAYRASDVIARTRAFLKRGEQQRVSLHIGEVLEEVANLVQGEARARDVSIRVRAAGNLPPVRGDRVQLQQVVLNLALNAIEAMRDVTDRPRRLEVGAEYHDDGDSVLITVTDSGAGVDRQQIDRVFDAFFTTKREGMGMGLAISRTIVEAHGGRLWATNNPSHGATFQFLLPAVIRDAQTGGADV
jgi:PAS domain S-box-containing protein